MIRLIRVMVTGVAGGSIGEQVCKALEFGHWQYEITATNMARGATCIVNAENHETLPPVTDSKYLEALLKLVERHKIEFIIPGSDPELRMLSQWHEAVTQAGARLLINTEAVISLCLDKFKSFEFLAAQGFRVPAMFVGNEGMDSDSISGDPPWIVKPGRGGGGSTLTFIAQDQAELKFFVQYLLRQGYRPFIQEYVGDVENEYTVGVLHSPECDFFGAVALRRQILSGLSNRLRLPNRTGRGELGPDLAISSGISQGRLVDFEPVLSVAREIATCLGSRGPLNIQGRWDGNHFIPFEINPRFSGTAPMRAMAGLNEPELLIAWHLGIERPFVYTDIRYGEYARGLSEYFISEIDEC